MRGGVLGVALSMALVAPAAFAEQSPALDRFNIAVGAFRGDTNTDLSAHTKGLPQNASGRVSLEDDLGFKDHQTIYRFRIDGLIGDHNGWAVDYYNLNRDRSKGLAGTVPYQGRDVAVSANARGRMNLDLGSVSYRYWLGQSKDVFGVGLGAAYYHVDFSVGGQISAPSEGVAASDRASYREGAWAPELTLGYRHQFNDQWRLYANAAGIKKNGGPLEGHIYSGSVGIEYYPWAETRLKGLGFGLEYAVSKVELRQQRRAYTAQLDLKTYGPGAYVHYRF